MNEILFFCHLLVIAACTCSALRLGKEALTAWVAIQAILANLFVTKQILLWGFQVTCSDSFVIGTVLSLNLIQEYYGSKSAQKASWLSLYFLALFALLSQIHLFYRPSPHDTMQVHFTPILRPTFRLSLASLLTFLLVQQCDIRFLAFLKRHLSSFVKRNTLSLLVSQFLDTLLFTFLGLYGLVFSLRDVFCVSFSVKILAILALTPCISWIKKRFPLPGESR